MSWLSTRGPIDDPRAPKTTLDAATVAQWRAAANLQALTRAWAAQPPADAVSAAAAMLRWRRRDVELRRGPDLGQRRHAIAARDDPYRSPWGQQSSRILFVGKLTRMPRDRRVRLFGVSGPSQRLLSGPSIPWHYG